VHLSEILPLTTSLKETDLHDDDLSLIIAVVVIFHDHSVYLESKIGSVIERRIQLPKNEEIKLKVVSNICRPRPPEQVRFTLDILVF
jgi:hypothetical protein